MANGTLLLRGLFTDPLAAILFESPDSAILKKLAFVLADVYANQWGNWPVVDPADPKKSDEAAEALLKTIRSTTSYIKNLKDAEPLLQQWANRKFNDRFGSFHHERYKSFGKRDRADADEVDDTIEKHASKRFRTLNLHPTTSFVQSIKQSGDFISTDHIIDGEHPAGYNSSTTTTIAGDNEITPTSRVRQIAPQTLLSEFEKFSPSTATAINAPNRHHAVVIDNGKLESHRFATERASSAESNSSSLNDTTELRRKLSLDLRWPQDFIDSMNQVYKDGPYEKRELRKLLCDGCSVWDSPDAFHQFYAAASLHWQTVDLRDARDLYGQIDVHAFLTLHHRGEYLILPFFKPEVAQALRDGRAETVNRFFMVFLDIYRAQPVFDARRADALMHTKRCVESLRVAPVELIAWAVDQKFWIAGQVEVKEEASESPSLQPFDPFPKEGELEGDV